MLIVRKVSVLKADSHNAVHFRASYINSIGSKEVS